MTIDDIARALPNVMSQEVCDEVYGPGVDPLDVPYEWYMTPRELAAEIVDGLALSAVGSAVEEPKSGGDERIRTAE